MSQKVGIMGITLPSQVHFFFLSAFPFFRMKMIQAHRRKFGEQQSEERKKSPTSLLQHYLGEKHSRGFPYSVSSTHLVGLVLVCLFYTWLWLVGQTLQCACVFLFFSFLCPPFPPSPSQPEGGVSPSGIRGCELPTRCCF